MNEDDDINQRPAARLSEKQRLEAIVNRFRPIVGDDPNKGKLRGDFYAAAYFPENAQVVSAFTVSKLLVEAGVRKSNITVMPADTSGKTQKNEFVIISESDYEKLKEHVSKKINSAQRQ